MGDQKEKKIAISSRPSLVQHQHQEFPIKNPNNVIVPKPVTDSTAAKTDGAKPKELSAKKRPLASVIQDQFEDADESDLLMMETPENLKESSHPPPVASLASEKGEPKAKKARTPRYSLPSSAYKETAPPSASSALTASTSAPPNPQQQQQQQQPVAITPEQSPQDGTAVATVGPTSAPNTTVINPTITPNAIMNHHAALNPFAAAMAHHHQTTLFQSYLNAQYAMSMQAQQQQQQQQQQAMRARQYQQTQQKKQQKKQQKGANSKVPVIDADPEKVQKQFALAAKKAAMFNDFAAEHFNRPKHPKLDKPPPFVKNKKERKKSKKQLEKEAKDETIKNRDTQVNKWQRRYEQAKLFVAKHGHCIIPNEYDEIPGLGGWAKRQRYQYQIFSRGAKVSTRISSMCPERIRMLDAIGFCWHHKDRRWLSRYSELLQFINRHGHAAVPTVYNGNQELAGWVKVQRRQYRLFIQKGKSSMTEERIKLLNKVGFVWRVNDDDEYRADLAENANSLPNTKVEDATAADGNGDASQSEQKNVLQEAMATVLKKDRTIGITHSPTPTNTATASPTPSNSETTITPHPNSRSTLKEGTTDTSHVTSKESDDPSLEAKAGTATTNETNTSTSKEDSDKVTKEVVKDDSTDKQTPAVAESSETNKESQTNKEGTTTTFAAPTLKPTPNLASWSQEVAIVAAAGDVGPRNWRTSAKPPAATAPPTPSVKAATATKSPATTATTENPESEAAANPTVAPTMQQPTTFPMGNTPMVPGFPATFPFPNLPAMIAAANAMGLPFPMPQMVPATAQQAQFPFPNLATAQNTAQQSTFPKPNPPTQTDAEQETTTPNPPTTQTPLLPASTPGLMQASALSVASSLPNPPAGAPLPKTKVLDEIKDRIAVLRKKDENEAALALLGLN